MTTADARAIRESKMKKVATEYSFTIPVPPSVNRYWMIANNRFITTPEARAYKQEIAYKLSSRMQPLTGNVGVNFTVFRPARRGDLDNYCKCMFDALQGICYENDNQIVEFQAYRDDDKDNPRVEFLVYEIES